MSTEKKAPAITAGNVAPEKFAGKWYVVATNYNFWKSKSRTHPVINLDLLNEPAGGRTFLSRVEYKWKGSPRTITGYETQDTSTPGRYVWKGKGLLSIIKNEWYLIAVAPDLSWAFTFFPKSNIGTPEGIDVLSRTPEMSEELLQKIIAQVREDEFMRSKTENIFRTIQK